MFKKAIVETVGPYMYIDTHTGLVIEDNRPTVAQVTPFLSQKIADGLITLLVPNIPVEADDKEFAEYYASFKGAETAKESAIASYVSKFDFTNETKVPQSITPVKPVTVPEYKDDNKTEEELLAELEAEEAAKKLAEQNAKKDEVKPTGFFNKKS